MGFFIVIFCRIGKNNDMSVEIDWRTMKMYAEELLSALPLKKIIGEKFCQVKLVIL